MAFTDNFTEASDTALESHTPSGGTAWTLTGAAGAATVIAATGVLRSASATPSTYICDDQGSADHVVTFRSKVFNVSPPSTSAVCVRLVDASNYIGWRFVGTGASGRRLSKNVGGTVTDLITSQPVSNEWIKVEASGTTIKLFAGGTGASPTWTQVGANQTVSDHSTETSQGVRIGSSVSMDWIDDFEAAALGGGGVTGTIAVTLAAFTSSITGTTTVVGTTAATMAAFTSAITGTSEIPGTIAAVTEDAVGALDGTVGTGGPTGTIAGLGADFTASMMGTTTVVGASSAQMEDFLSSIAGTTTVVGTMAITSDDMIMTANGFVGDAPSARFRTLVGMGE